MKVSMKIEGVSEAAMRWVMLQQEMVNRTQKAMWQATQLAVIEAKDILTTIQWRTKAKAGLRRKSSGAYFPPGALITGHIDFGTLKRSVQGRSYWKSTGMVEGIVGTDTEYAPYVEAFPDGGFAHKAINRKRVMINKLFQDLVRDAAISILRSRGKQVF